MPDVSVPQVTAHRQVVDAEIAGPSRADRRADRQARAAVATLQILTGVLLGVTAVIGDVAVAVAVVLVQLSWVAVAGRVLGLTFSGRAVIAATALLATAAVEWQRRADSAPTAEVSAGVGVLAVLLALVVVAAVFVQLSRRGPREDLTVRLSGTVLVAVLGVFPAELLSITGDFDGRAAIAVLAGGVALAGAATGLGVGELGSGGLGSGVPEPATSQPRIIRTVRDRTWQRLAQPVRARLAGGGAAVVAAVLGAAAAALVGSDQVGVGGAGDRALAAGVVAYAVFAVAAYLSALAAGTVARATPTTRVGGVVAASLAVAMATPLLLVLMWVVR